MFSTYNLIKRGPHVYTGGESDQPIEKILVDVKSFPETFNMTYQDVPKDAVTAAVRKVTEAVESGKDVLVRCEHGIGRSPTVAKLALIGMGEEFNCEGYCPVYGYSSFVRANYWYYKNQDWKK